MREKFQELRSKLEAKLGPDTGDLALRYVIDSGFIVLDTSIEFAHIFVFKNWYALRACDSRSFAWRPRQISIVWVRLCFGLFQLVGAI